MAEVLHLFFSIAHRLPMRELPAARAILDRGFANCAHAQPGGKRQVLLMDVETLGVLGLTPGALKENITTRGLKLMELERGQVLRAGEALVEVTLPCEPCRLMDDIRPGLQQELRGRRGMLCRVVREGIIRRGDPVEICVAPASPMSGVRWTPSES